MFVIYIRAALEEKKAAVDIARFKQRKLIEQVQRAAGAKSPIRCKRWNMAPKN
jgi:hypothetical protein